MLYNHREAQLENYNNNVPVSKSDFHHLKPPNWGKRISTCQFTQPGRNGHARTVSRFTVISNVQDVDDVGTIRSYDPYNASRVLHPCTSQASHARIIVHRNNTDAGLGPSPTSISHSYRSYKSAVGSFRQRPRTGSRRTSTSGHLRSPQSSMSSIRSHYGTPRVRVGSRSKRAVDFSGVRSKGHHHRRNRHASLAAPASIAGDNTTYDRDTLSPASPRKEQKTHRVTATRSMMEIDESDTFIWSEELEQLGHRIAQDCDEAFSSSLLLSEPSEGGVRSREASPFTLSLGDLPAMLPSERRASANESVGAHPWDNRPLPPVPSQNTASPVSTRDQDPSLESTCQSAKTYKPYSKLNAPVPERRVVSEPAYERTGRDSRPLPSIFENTPDEWSKHKNGRGDIASSPLETPTRVKSRGLEFLSKAENTIRVVNSPTATRAEEPVRMPKPLNVRKVSRNTGSGKPTLASALQDPQRHTSHGSHQNSQATDGPGSDNHIPSKHRVSSWFKRASKEDASGSSFVTVTEATMRSKETLVDSVASRQSADVSSGPRAQKKKSFGFPFWKGSRNELKMSLAGKQDSHSVQMEGRALTRCTRLRPGRCG